MENEIYSVLERQEDLDNINHQLCDRILYTYANTFVDSLTFYVDEYDQLFVRIKHDKLENKYPDYVDFNINDIVRITIPIKCDNIDKTNEAIEIAMCYGIIKELYIEFGNIMIGYIPYKQSEQNKQTDESFKPRSKRVIDNTSMVVELPRFNANAFEFGEAYFIKSKSIGKAAKLLKYKHHCDDEVNGWIPENYDDIAKQIEYGVYALFKSISHQGTLISFFVACRDVDSDTTKRCVELSIPIDAMDDIEITKLDIDAFTRKEKKNED